MVKRDTQFVCQECGSATPRWQGRCTVCNAWNSLVEEATVSATQVQAFAQPTKAPVALNQITPQPERLLMTHMPEFDRLMGQGLVSGSVILLGGEPGIGKSTLSLQLASRLCQSNEASVLYVSGEESERQIYQRAQRLGVNSSTLFLFCEINIQTIVKVIREKQPQVVILDSIQVVFHPDMPSSAGSINQVRQCAWELINLAKELDIVVVLIGHITKDGGLAGPKVLEHMVDVILFFEGDRNQKYRLLRCFKNRYASTDEMGLFEMGKTGLTEVVQITDLFIDQDTLANPGSMVVPVLQGGRVMLIEVQALVVNSGYGMAKRTFTGVDTSRANLLIAAMEKAGKFRLSTKDIFLNIIGGLKIAEPAMDLGIVLAIMSSGMDRPLQTRMAVVGEVGLTGEVRSVPNIEKRLSDVDKMGFTHCILPHTNAVKSFKTNLQLIYVKTIREAIQAFLDISKTQKPQ